MDNDGSPPPPKQRNTSRPGPGLEKLKVKPQTGQPRHKNCGQCQRWKKACVAVPGQACRGCQEANKDCTHASNVAPPVPVAAAAAAAASYPAGYNTPTAVAWPVSDHVGQRQAGPANLLPEPREINTLPMAGFPGTVWNSQGSPGYRQPPTTLYGSSIATEAFHTGDAPYGLAIDPWLWAPDHDPQHPELGLDQGYATSFRSMEPGRPFHPPPPFQGIDYPGQGITFSTTVAHQENNRHVAAYVGYAEPTASTRTAPMGGTGGQQGTKDQRKGTIKKV